MEGNASVAGLGCVSGAAASGGAVPGHLEENTGSYLERALAEGVRVHRAGKQLLH